MSFQIIQFAEAKQPEYKEKKGEGYIQYGDKNDYPSYLIDLFNKSAKHGAIIRSKVHYICGMVGVVTMLLFSILIEQKL